MPLFCNITLCINHRCQKSTKFALRNSRKNALRKLSRGFLEMVDILDTKAWKMADWDYSDMVVRDMIPLLNDPLSIQERIERLNEILKVCPEYYPALIELGYRHIQEGRDEIGKISIDKGLQSLAKYFSKKDLKDAYYDVCEFLENHLRFEMAIEYYNKLLKIEEDKAYVYDCIGACYSYLGDFEKAFEIQQKTLKLCDSNHRFYCNMGWIEMLRGNLNAAKNMLEKSLQLNQTHEVTLKNYEICKLMLKNKQLKNWEAYLLKGMDYEDIKRLEDEDGEYEKQIQIYNRNRVEAFKFALMRNSNYTPARKYDILFTLNYVFDIIQKSYSIDYFFNDDIAEVRENFEPIMYRVILTTSDIDDEILGDIYTSLLEFYEFLAKQKVIPECKSLEEKMLKLKPEIRRKMLRYNEIRHNDEYTEEKKDRIREELFGEDAFLPFL